MDQKTCEAILRSRQTEILPLVNAAYEIRKKYWGNGVTVHIINNLQNGLCSEDCHYCAQSKSSCAKIEKYPMKSEGEILREAKIAYQSGTFRYCMVSSGRSPSEKHVDYLVSLIKKIKKLYPIEVCVSPGILDEQSIRKLKQAGLNRLNHNLNTSARYYSKICTTHTFQDRLNTLKVARKAGLDVCSGVIFGMGESVNDIIDLALTFRKLGVASIPVNFLLPIPGNILKEPKNLTPEFCLRILCLFRFLNPKSEIRIAAGREIHLRSLEAMALYPANSLFMDGYLNTQGSNRVKTLRMIKDAGFTIVSEQKLDDLLKKEYSAQRSFSLEDSAVRMKSAKDLHPQKQICS
ncbi:MAG TPA: biotin synthase BioB [Candidatus Omnitrophota bacterium]|nr:biotin synthase BioB [Candidatus Omnitrophota bacterium]HPD85418.1 biotin synthase BioB [Candidatus Omnitrophota bacterium]HRZ04081.1 biotin synthase BioB [Candidatus Omnitrophota bacterium]